MTPGFTSSPYYTNNRTNSYVRDGILYLRPTLTSETVSDPTLMSSELNLWGSTPADLCTGNAFFGCQRSGGGGGNVLNPIQSARLRTAHSFSFKYGRVEVRAKLPKGDWIWPAIWMLPRYNSYGGWPASGEIDIMESRGNTPGQYSNGGYDTFSSTLHWGPDYSRNKWMKTHQQLQTGMDLTAEFHVYGMKWDETGIYTYIDSESNKVLEIDFTEKSFWERGSFSSGEKNINNPWASRSNAAPFDQKFFLIMNVAVGGTGEYFQDGVGGKPWTNKDPHAANAFWAAKGQWLPTWKDEDVAMKIDWVKVFA